MSGSKKPPASRRRSSAYRPHNWTYPVLVLPIHRESISLEQLPVVTLARIFDLLSTGDLLNVCVASKYFYLPAVMKLYRRIVITNKLLASYARQFLTNWDANYGTAMVADKAPQFLEVIGHNEKLALLVHTIIVTETDPVPLLPEILLATNVKELYYVDDGHIPQKILNNMLKLTASIKVPLIAPLLTELRLCNFDTDSSPDNYRMLAVCMLENETYHNLHTLAFEITDDRNLRKLNRLNTDFERPVAGWVLFFAAFVQLGVKLQLSSLTLEGHVRDSGTQIASLLNEAVDLDYLTSLALLCSELSHAHVPHYDNSTTLLENLTKHTSSLTNLAISPSDDCLTCQVAAITHTLLTNIAGQLKNLLVVFESPNPATADSVKMAIVENQRNLVKLRFREKTTQGGLKSEIYHNLDPAVISDWEHGAYYNYRIRRDFFPTCSTFMEGPQITSDPFVKCVRENGTKIAKALMKDLVLRNAPAKMPRLIEYELIDFTLSVKDQAFLLNGMKVPHEMWVPASHLKDSAYLDC